MKERILWLLALSVIFTLGLAGTTLAEPSVADWTLNTVDGGTVNFHDTLEKGPVVLSFWATWCKPCLKDMVHLNNYAKQFEGQISFLAVNTDNSKSVAKVAPVLSAKGYNNLIVPMDTGAELSSMLQVTGIVPFLIIYDSQGREVYRHVGYKKGDEKELLHEIEKLLAAEKIDVVVNTGKPDWAEAVSATNKFKYSFSNDTQKEIFENWLDVSYQFGGFRSGIMLNSQAPSEYGDRQNAVVHRFFEFDSGDVSVRAGHFYGLFGRGMIFNSYEDRAIRIDTRLDGIIASIRKDRYTATVFSGSPSARALDVRGADVEYHVVDNLFLGASGMTYRWDDSDNIPSDLVMREWVASLRARQNFGYGDFYIEHGWKKGFDFDRLSLDNADGNDEGRAFYSNLNFYTGPFSFSWEHSYYSKFRVIPDADTKTTLNRPPSLAREFAWTMLNRSPHNMDADNETGNNLDLMYSNDDGWTVIASGAQLRELDRNSYKFLDYFDTRGDIVYELAFGSIQKDGLGPFRVTGGFAYQDNEGLRQTAFTEITYKLNESNSLAFQAEHQHVRLGGGYGYDLGAYDVQWFKLELETAPSWSFATMLEINNKYDEQRPSTEGKGPFVAGQISYSISRGGNLNLWMGSRQAGYICSGGVCKIEPAFEGVEFYGLFRY